MFTELNPELVADIYQASQQHFNSEISPATYAAAMDIYHKTGLIKENVPYEDVVATQFANIWNASQPTN
jgi:hypothetical protein